MEVALPGTPQISVIIPARNEEACLGQCLQSLATQDSVKYEITVVDDNSTDGTREIAESFPGVRVASAGPLPAGWTGKNNALVSGVRQARGAWLLFTDADTVHLPGSLAHALAEAKSNQADLLSYSPQQVAKSFWERAVMPVVFAELAAQYPPQKVRDQGSGVVAANGQYILVRREAYERVGGHAAVASQILEDVALARAFRAAGFRVHFRYGDDLVRARMYRNWGELREGWTKNLALLFPRPAWRATWITGWWAFSWITFPLGLASIIGGYWKTAFYSASAILLYQRISRAHFSFVTTLLACVVGPPVFAYLLIRSRHRHRKGEISWKGRQYNATMATGESNDPVRRPSQARAES